MMQKCVHFVGFRSEHEWNSAVRVWGQPDFVHHVHDGRGQQEVDWDHDVVVFGKSHEWKEWSFDDSSHV